MSNPPECVIVGLGNKEPITDSAFRDFLVSKVDETLNYFGLEEIPDATYLLTPYRLAKDSLYMVARRIKEIDGGVVEQKAKYRFQRDQDGALCMTAYHRVDDETLGVRAYIRPEFYDEIAVLSSLAFFIARSTN